MIFEKQDNELILFALQKLQMKMKRIVGTANVPGQWSRYFNGKTNIDMSSLDIASIVSFGTKDLFGKSEGLRNALLRLVFNYSWANCLGTID